MRTRQSARSLKSWRPLRRSLEFDGMPRKTTPHAATRGAEARCRSSIKNAPANAVWPAFCVGFLWLAATPLAAQTLSADAAATAVPPPCRSARAIYDLSCPNYTGFAHPIDADSGSPDADASARSAGAPALGSPEGSAALSLREKGPEIQRGLASWYGERHHGARTASGEPFSKDAFTAAHKTLPFGTRVLVRNVRTGREAVVRITDRGPHTRNRVIDVSKAAAEALGMVARGQDTVVIHALGRSMDGDVVNTIPASGADQGF